MAVLLPSQAVDVLGSADWCMGQSAPATENQLPGPATAVVSLLVVPVAVS